MTIIFILLSCIGIVAALHPYTTYPISLYALSRLRELPSSSAATKAAEQDLAGMTERVSVGTTEPVFAGMTERDLAGMTERVFAGTTELQERLSVFLQERLSVFL